MDAQSYRTAVIRFIRSGREYFFHTNGRGYVDIDDLLDMQAEGEAFRVFDEETGADVTRVVLA